jgi:hypothetical protein
LIVVNVFWWFEENVVVDDENIFPYSKKEARDIHRCG